MSALERRESNCVPHWKDVRVAVCPHWKDVRVTVGPHCKDVRVTVCRIGKT